MILITFIYILVKKNINPNEIIKIFYEKLVLLLPKSYFRLLLIVTYPYYDY